MGLFNKKRAVDPAELAALRAEFSDVRARLDAAEHARAYLEARLGSLDATASALSVTATHRSTELHEQLDGLSRRIAATESSTGQLGAMGARIIRIEEHQAVIASEPRAAEMASKLTALAGRLEELARTVTEAAAADASEELRARLDHVTAALVGVQELAGRVERLDAEAAAQARLASEVALLHDRVGELQAHAAEVGDVGLRVDRLLEQAPVADHLHARLDQVHGRLDGLASTITSTDHLHARLEEQAGRLDQLAARTPDLTDVHHRLDDLAHRIAGLGGDARARVDELAARVAWSDDVADVRRRLEDVASSPSGLDELEQELRTLRERVGETDDLAGRLAAVAEQVSVTASEARQARELAAALDARIGSIGAELTNQLTELGREIDELSALREADATNPREVAVTEELLAALRSGQTKLANEQARYEIAFRADLALLAEQVRQLRARS